MILPAKVGSFQYSFTVGIQPQFDVKNSPCVDDFPRVSPWVFHIYASSFLLVKPPFFACKTSIFAASTTIFAPKTNHFCMFTPGVFQQQVVLEARRPWNSPLLTGPWGLLSRPCPSFLGTSGAAAGATFSDLGEPQGGRWGLKSGPPPKKDGMGLVWLIVDFGTLW